MLELFKILKIDMKDAPRRRADVIDPGLDRREPESPENMNSRLANIRRRVQVYMRY